MQICIDSLACRTSVGVFDWEKKVLQQIMLDVELEVLNQKSVVSDRIEDTISYKDLSKNLRKHVQSQHFGLIERIAHECCQIVLDFNGRVTRVQVQVSKPGALNGCQNVRAIEELHRHQAIIGIGSNVDPKKHIAIAKDALKRDFDVLAIASDLRTKAIARKDEPDFINTALLLNTGVSRESLTRRLKHIEWETGRTASKDRYGKRVIDLDLLLWNQNLEDADILSRYFLQQSIEELLPGVLKQICARYGFKQFQPDKT